MLRVRVSRGHPGFGYSACRASRRSGWCASASERVPRVGMLYIDTGRPVKSRTASAWSMAESSGSQQVGWELADALSV